MENLLSSVEYWQFENLLAIDANGRVLTFNLTDGQHSYALSITNKLLLGAVLDQWFLSRNYTAGQIEDMSIEDMLQILVKTAE